MSKLFSFHRSRRFHFGVQWTLFWRRKHLLEFIRHPFYAELRMYHKCLLKWGRSSDIARDTFNCSNDYLNFQPRPKRSGVRILYIVEGLGRKGGIETRLHKQFSYLQNSGQVTPFLLTHQSDFVPFFKFIPLILDFRAPNFINKIIALVIFHKIDIVEFQMDPQKFLPFDILESIRCCRENQRVKLGVCLHSADFEAAACLPFMEYSVVTTGALHNAPSFSSAVFVPNWIKNAKSIWKYSGQKTALLISRIDKEKLPTIINFVRICQSNNIPFEIAGDCVENEQWTNAIQDATGVDITSSLLGLIDTVPYLTKNKDRYLFIAGVGQVPLEASSSGFPTVVIPHANAQFATFVTKETIAFLANWNFVIRYCPLDPILGNFDIELSRLLHGEVDRFDVTGEINASLSEKNSMDIYLRCIEAKPECGQYSSIRQEVSCLQP